MRVWIGTEEQTDGFRWTDPGSLVFGRYECWLDYDDAMKHWEEESHRSFGLACYHLMEIEAKKFAITPSGHGKGSVLKEDIGEIYKIKRVAGPDRVTRKCERCTNETCDNRVVPEDEDDEEDNEDCDTHEGESDKMTTKKNKDTQTDIEIVRKKKGIITLPEGMSYAEGIKWLHRKAEEEEQDVAVSESIRAFPLDGALAFTKALAKKYGWTNLVPTPGFFGPRPPAMIGVEVAPGETIQVPWGRIKVPSIDGYLETSWDVDNGTVIFRIGGVVKRKNETEVTAIATLTRSIVAKESIYKGKAIRIKFDKDDEDPRFDPNDCPKFIETKNVKEEELIFSADVETLVKTSLFTPVEHTEQCRRHKIPLKRGVLLEGPYGTGKTLTAYVAAKKCVENDWTFIYLENIDGLQESINFAKQYAPALIFAEDIDMVLAGNRDTDMNQILNTIDGVDSKDSEVIVVLTTNNVEKIHQAMLRPGRLDSVVSVRPPDAEAAIKLVRLYSRGLLPDTEDLAAVGEKLNGQIPSVIREVVERSKLFAISHATNGDLKITASDLFNAAESMLRHLELLAPKEEDNRPNMVKFGEAVGIEIGRAVHRHGSVLDSGNGQTARS